MISFYDGILQKPYKKQFCGHKKRALRLPDLGGVFNRAGPSRSCRRDLKNGIKKSRGGAFAAAVSVIFLFCFCLFVVGLVCDNIARLTA